MKYLFLLHSPDGPPMDQSSVEYAERFAAYAKATAAMAEAGGVRVDYRRSRRGVSGS
jgi:hypothetical protein